MVRRAAFPFLLAFTLAAQAAGLEPGAISDDPIWTDRPMRVDRTTQAYERLAVEPAPLSLRIRPTARVTVFDSASFRHGERLYLLTDAVPVDPKRRCRSKDGAVAACGQQARIALKRLIAGRALTCKEDIRFADLIFLTCSAGGKDLAETLVAQGAAWAATPRLLAVQREAMRKDAGIWIDAECRPLGRCPPNRRR